MLIEFNDNRVLILPKIKSDKQRKAGFLKTRRLLPGVNEVDDDYWTEARQHKSIQLKLEKKVIVEIVKETAKAKKIKEELQKKENAVEDQKTKIKEETAKKRKTKNKAEKEQIEEVIEEEKEILDELIDEKDAVETSLNKELSNFHDLSTEEKERIISETYDLETLDKWYKKSTELIKGIIKDRMESIRKSKSNPKIG